LDIFDEIAFPGILRVSAVNLFRTATIRASRQHLRERLSTITGAVQRLLLDNALRSDKRLSSIDLDRILLEAKRL